MTHKLQKEGLCVFNTADLSPFKGSHFDFVLSNVSSN